ncbi:MAG: hypothetical protein KME23_00380 [Goleter apudmare HA4340-LM2]|nr:hypothetical protein [Goleter apudmare HA4340-LM2]
MAWETAHGTGSRGSEMEFPADGNENVELVNRGILRWQKWTGKQPHSP